MIVANPVGVVACSALGTSNHGKNRALGVLQAREAADTVDLDDWSELPIEIGISFCLV